MNDEPLCPKCNTPLVMEHYYKGGFVLRCPNDGLGFGQICATPGMTLLAWKRRNDEWQL